MNVKEIREMEDQSIREEITRLTKDVMGLRMANAIGTEENPVQIRFKRRDIARLNTVLRERELAK